MTKAMAEVDKCTNYTSSHEHSMRDYCWTCAPYWDIVPLCPTHRRKLATSGYCKDCRRYYDMTTYLKTTSGG